MSQDGPELFTFDEWYEAVRVWFDIKGSNDEFWAFMKTSVRTSFGKDCHDPAVAERVRILLGPHAVTIVKAWLIVRGIEP